MPEKQHRARLPRAFGFGLLLLASSGCALLADIGGPAKEGEVVVGTGSNSPEMPAGTSQGAGGTPSPNTCLAQLDSDLHNCGFCGHDCGGAECKQGLCVPAPIVSISQVSALAVEDDEHVIFTTASDVERCLVGSSQASCASVVTPEVVFTAAQSTRYGLTTGGDGEGRPNNSPMQTSTSGAPKPLAPRALALYGERFYVADQTNGVVFACPRSGCSAGAIGTVKPRSSPVFAGGLAIDASTVVWGERDAMGQGPNPPSGGRESGSPVSGVTGARDVTRIEMLRAGVSYEDLVFRGGDGVIYVPADPSRPLRTILAGASLRDIAIDARFFYVAGGGALVRVDRTTNAKTTLLQLPGAEVARVVADDLGVYATVKTAGSERVVRVRESGVDTVASGAGLGPLGLSPLWLFVVSSAGITRVAR